jgi:hypothetical protein
MKKIIVLWASIRPDMVQSTWLDWLSKCNDTQDIYIKLAVATEEQKQKIEGFGFKNCEIIVVKDKLGYPYAITQLTKQLETDDESILLLLSDDFFAPDNWDIYLRDKFTSYDGAIFLNDGYQLPVKRGNLCITLACLTFSCLKKLNKIVFHPDYTHFFCDNEAWANLVTLELLQDNRDIDKTIFEHRHYNQNKRVLDEHDKRNMSNWNVDHLTYDRRMLMSIEERLK